MADLALAAVANCTRAEGPHRRMALWTAGCSLRCPGCCNPEFFSATPAQRRSHDELMARVHDAKAQHDIEGVTLLGGEPTEQPVAVGEFCAAVQGVGLGVILFSGYTLEQLREREGFERWWPHVDTLVDGAFDARRLERERPAPSRRRFVGSTNQRLIHRTPRYAAEALWRGEVSVEVQIAPDGRMSMHGEPALARRTARSLRVVPEP